MWLIESTIEFDLWIYKQDISIREAILSQLYVLAEKGPNLGRPYVDTIQGTKINNLKELRVQVKLKVIRIFFIFTKDRIGLILNAGDKKGNDRFYEEMIPKAIEIYQKWERENEEIKPKAKKSKTKRN
ncbi:type II toxin-antitoxin system RelE/ParE family toxin [Leptospira sp. GIMC2001]|uniref:type II toxin-antitoxin system RelE/ParE family toxin n=1 Tax=Leptospira sp. GIMC2001 TaxID=1513297 RepID=UPI0023491407|nr:type II toxin-antitoxin system RelE/ParE family toxin [Leptospira sp. GIMC2001]WCL50678.1 type II toxin-antitoxin system RelE/ParE family toxin [Leptospira sp. GIMC2001]WCL50712.1 type II toxin-antitoxin system RelE/ParE family toxin [Leptospira sp. GIMC2001]